MSSNPDPEDTVVQYHEERKRLSRAGRWIVTALVAAVTIVSGGIVIWNQFEPGHRSVQSPKTPNHSQITKAPTITVPTSTTPAPAVPSPNPTATSAPAPTATPIPAPTATPSPAYFDAEFPDNNIPKTIQGPAIVQWADPDCGIFELNQGKTFTWNSDGHYWLFHNQQSLDYFYPSYRQQYFQQPQNASCIEGPP